MNKNRITLRSLIPGKVGVGATAALALGVVLIAANSALAAVVVRVSTSDALPGGTLTLQMRVDRGAGDGTIAGVQADLILSTDQLSLVGACSSDQSACENGTACPNQGRCVPSCQADTRLTQHALAAAFPDFQNVPTGSRRLRLPLNPDAFPPPTLDDGLLVTCTFAVLPGAALGPIQITSDSARFRVTDEVADPVVARLELQAGSIVSMLSTATATATQTPVPATATQTVATATANVPTSTPTSPQATVTATVPQATATSIVAATATPTRTDTVVVTPTATLTAAPASATPTRTTAVPTSTPIEPTRTMSVQPTATQTTSVGTPTRTTVPATSTPTSGSSGNSNDDDGCAMAPRDSARPGTGAGALVWAFGAMFVWLRRDPR